MADEAATATTEAPPTSLTPGTAPGVTVEVKDPDGAPDAGEVTQTEGEPDESPPWHEPYSKALSEAESLDAALEHEAFADVRSRIETAKRDGARDGQKRVQPIYEDALSNIESASSAMGKLADFLFGEEGDEDTPIAGALPEKEVTAFLKKNPEVGRALNGLTATHSFWQGFGSFIAHLAEIKAIPAEMLEDAGEQVNMLRLMTLRKGRNQEQEVEAITALTKDVLKAATKTADAQGFERGKAAGIALGRKNQADEDAAMVRRNGKPVAEVKGGGSGAHKAYKDMTREERAALSSEQRDAWSAA